MLALELKIFNNHQSDILNDKLGIINANMKSKEKIYFLTHYF